jgi:hypothetical protein
VKRRLWQQRAAARQKAKNVGEDAAEAAEAGENSGRTCEGAPWRRVR